MSNVEKAAALLSKYLPDVDIVELWALAQDLDMEGLLVADKTKPMSRLEFEDSVKHDRIYGFVKGLDDNETYEAEVTKNSLESNVIISETKRGKHKPLLDLDFSHTYVPSSTPGHGHLYIHEDYDYQSYLNMMRCLRDSNLIQPGVFNSLERNGYNAVRLPWIRKPNAV